MTRPNKTSKDDTLLMLVSFPLYHSHYAIQNIFEEESNGHAATKHVLLTFKGEVWGKTFFCPFLFLLFLVEKNGPGVF